MPTASDQAKSIHEVAVIGILPDKTNAIKSDIDVKKKNTNGMSVLTAAAMSILSPGAFKALIDVGARSAPAITFFSY